MSEMLSCFGNNSFIGKKKDEPRETKYQSPPARMGKAIC